MSATLALTSQYSPPPLHPLIHLLTHHAVPTGPVTHSSGGIAVNAEGDIPARARLLKGHTVVALADPNPEDPNSALLTHIQVSANEV